MSTGLRYGLAFCVPFAATMLLTPLAAKLAHRTGIIDHPKERRFHSQATPFLGGVAVAGGLVLVATITTGTQSQIVTILLGALALGALGLVDDWRGVRPLVKVAVEAGCGVALWIAGVRAGFFGIEALDLALTVLWVVAVVNAVNMLDNMDGVASGVVALSAFGFFAIAASEGDYLVASLSLAVVGSSLGFLRHNFPPARIFLGDAGTLMIGFLLAALGLKLDLIGPSNVVRAIIPALALAVPLFDMVLVIVDRARGHRPVYLGGTDHTAHRLAERGLSIRAVALAAYATQLVCSAAAYLLRHASDGSVLVAGVAVAAVALIAWGLLLRMDGVRPDGGTLAPDPSTNGERSRTTPRSSSSAG